MQNNLVQQKIRENLIEVLYENQIDDSDVCSFTNIPIERLNKIRLGKCFITFDEIYRICSSLNISVDYLFGFSDVTRHICYSDYSLLTLNDENRKSAIEFIKYLKNKQNSEHTLDQADEA